MAAEETRMAALEERIGKFEAMLRDPIILANALLELLRESRPHPPQLN